MNTTNNDTTISVDKRRQALKDIVQTVIVPVIAAAAFFQWAFRLVEAKTAPVLTFPLSGAILLFLYFLSGNLYAGVLLGFLTVAGFLSVVISGSAPDRMIFFLETAWLWTLFALLERFRKWYRSQGDRAREEEDILETKITLFESGVEENVTRASNLSQRIANYQLLGRMVQTLGTTLDEEKITVLVEELAGRFIGKGTWKVKKGFRNDIFAQYVKNHRVPLVVRNLSLDDRFFVRRPRFLSVIAVPLELNERYWGVLKGVSPSPDVFDEDDLRLIGVLSGIASLALNNARLYQQTQELAITDGLTGLYVQGYFRERLAEELLRSRSHGLPLSVAILDLDFFKNINDTYGHAAGDVVLRQVATLLRRRLRETDFIGRYGGEEFAVIMPQTTAQEALPVVEEIRRSVEHEKFFLPVESFHPVQVRITVSIGLAGIDGIVIGGEELLRRADEALYRAKNNGRNRIETHGKDHP